MFLEGPEFDPECKWKMRFWVGSFAVINTTSLKSVTANPYAVAGCHESVHVA